MAMLSLGKWLSSKARLLLVLFTGPGSTDLLNYLRFPLVKTTETRRLCVCRKGGCRMEDRNEVAEMREKKK